MSSSGIKAQLYKGLIYQWQRYGKQKAKAMLVQCCPPCLLVRGTTALHWIRLMCSRYLPVNNITSSENLQCVFTEGKQILWEQSEAPLLPLHFNTPGRFMHTILFVCWVEERKEYYTSRAIYQTRLCSLYWLSVSTHSKNESAKMFTQEEYKSLLEMRPCCKKVWIPSGACILPLDVYLAYSMQSSAVDNTI